MRLRNIKGAKEVLAESRFVVQQPENYRGKWNTFFQNENPLHIEIGMGKGRFLTDLAKCHPDVNYLGIEKYASVLIRGVQKREEVELDNLYFISIDAETLPEVFADQEVDRIYLNFSDPWPKDRHAKRRLTSPAFFARYDQVLKADGRIEFKTDNRILFDYSLTAIPAAGWTITEQTFDLHNSPMGAGNIMTEYEEKFSGKGQPICKLIAVREKTW